MWLQLYTHTQTIDLYDNSLSITFDKTNITTEHGDKYPSTLTIQLNNRLQ